MKTLTLQDVKAISKKKYHCDCAKCVDILIDEQEYTCSQCYHCGKTPEQCDNIGDSWKCCEDGYGKSIIKGIRGDVNMYDLWCGKCKLGSENLTSKKLEFK